MKRIIRAGVVIAVIVLGLIGFTGTRSEALDPLLKAQCEKAVQKSVTKVTQAKENVRQALSDFLNLKVACEAGTIDAAICDKKLGQLALRVEKLTEKIDARIEEFFVAVYDRLPECGDELDELGVDDFNLF